VASKLRIGARAFSGPTEKDCRPIKSDSQGAYTNNRAHRGRPLVLRWHLSAERVANG